MCQYLANKLDYDFQQWSRDTLGTWNLWAQVRIRLRVLSRKTSSNHFSLLSNSDREGDPWSEKEVENVFTKSHPKVNDGGASQIGMMFLGVELVDGLQNGGSKLLLFPWEQMRVESNVSGSRERESGPLECVPLSQ